MDYLLDVVIFQIVIIQEKIGEIMRIGKTGEKYISFYGGKYTVQKKIDNISIMFARFDKLEEAIKHRDFCVKNNWNIEKCKLSKNTKRDGKYKYIYKLKNGSYQIMKFGKHYGVFNTYKEAEKHRDYCIKNNWSKECILRSREEYNKYNLPKYISYSKLSKRYIVAKEDKNTLVRIANYKKLEDAIYDRDLLIKVNWDEEKLFELDEAEGSL